ncbi:FlgO family outer membrane protein [Maribacter chungangensis]|uniref:FlgO family outer membrane protein n=1 Tax=Maribacter chungangensis TaxID=1069117 RepID=A0ABW3B2G3_9FLAO
MKQFLLLGASLLLLSTHLNAQDFDTKLEQLAQNIATKLDGKSKKRVAVWGFVTENGERNALGNYITEDFSVYLTNFGDNYEIIDRNHLDMLLKEHQLNSEGYIDENTAKELGKIVAVDAIITGTFTVLTTNVKVRAKVLDTETALQFAASMSNLPLNENVSSYLGISLDGENSRNKGFNTPLNSNETINDPNTVDKNCKQNMTGDFCFSNALNEKVIVRIAHYRDAKYHHQNTYKLIILNAKETKCVYGLINRPFNFYIASFKDFENSEKFRGKELNLSYHPYYKFLKDKGELKVETCRSKTYTIK